LGLPSSSSLFSLPRCFSLLSDGWLGERRRTQGGELSFAATTADPGLDAPHRTYRRPHRIVP
jgi:hypothetical protein